MTTTTINSMNFLAQKNDSQISAKIPLLMRKLMWKQAKKQNMSNSNYMKIAFMEKLERDLEKKKTENHL